MTQCGLCKDCRWWDNTFYTDRKEWGFCSAALCGDPKTNKRRNPNSKVKHTGWEEDLRTKSDFGCIQFEPKTEEG